MKPHLAISKKSRRDCKHMCAHFGLHNARITSRERSKEQSLRATCSKASLAMYLAKRSSMRSLRTPIFRTHEISWPCAIVKSPRPSPATMQVLRPLMKSRNSYGASFMIVLTKCMVSSLNRWNLPLSCQIKVLLSTLTFSHALPPQPILPTVVRIRLGPGWPLPGFSCTECCNCWAMCWAT